MAYSRKYKKKDGTVKTVWYITYTPKFKGKTTRERTNCQTKSDAKKIEQQKRAEVIRQRQIDSQQPTEKTVYLFDDLITRYLEEIQSKGRIRNGRRDLNSKDITRQLYSARHLAKEFASQQLSDIKRSEIIKYIDKRLLEGASSATITKEIHLLSTAINYAVRVWDWPITNIANGMAPGGNPHRTRHLTYNEYDALIAAARQSKQAPHLAPFIKLAVATGMRSGELLNLTWDRVQPDRITFNRGHTADGGSKSARQHDVVWLYEKSKEALDELLENRQESCPWVFHRNGQQIKSIKKSFRIAREKAGLNSDVVPHTLRHTFASWAINNGEPLEKIAKALRQTVLATTQQYAHLKDDAGKKVFSTVNRLS